MASNKTIIRKEKAQLKPGEAYRKIVYHSYEDRYITKGDKVKVRIPCVMCGQVAEYIAPETDEPLCLYCCRNNDEARVRK